MDIKKIAAAFGIYGENISFTECTVGHINDTYFVRRSPEAQIEFVFQKINTSIFKNPEQVMENIFNVTAHICKKLSDEGKDVSRGALEFLLTVDGKKGYSTEADEYWRVYKYLDDVVSLNSADTPELFKKSGYAFGNFQRQLADFDASVLHETIINFHNTVSRLEDFKAALKNNAAGRRDAIPEDIKFVLDREDKCSFIVDGIACGKFPLRVTHNDTKLNNLLIDKNTGDGICIVDLDTVMPGSALYDFGDAIRFGASSAAEDEADLDKVYIRLDMFDAYTEGFLKGVNGALTKEEIRAFPMGAYIITFETGIRFLTDYLNGDTYFRIHREGQNLDRARNQFKLVANMEEQMDKLCSIVENYI